MDEEIPKEKFVRWERNKIWIEEHGERLELLLPKNKRGALVVHTDVTSEDIEWMKLTGAEFGDDNNAELNQVVNFIEINRLKEILEKRRVPFNPEDMREIEEYNLETQFIIIFDYKESEIIDVFKLGLNKKK